MNRFKPPFGDFSQKEFDPKAHAEMKLKSLNDVEGNLTDYDCRICKNKGVVHRLREDGLMTYALTCDCAPKRHTLHLARESGLKKVMDKFSFDNFLVTEYWQKQALEMARDYAANPRGWFLAGGQSGSGKTHLCAAICAELIEKGMAVRYMPWREALDKLKDWENDGRSAYKEELMKAEVLYIDDLFKTGADAQGVMNPTVTDRSLAFEILNYREQQELLTMISTELMPSELYTLEAASGGRVLQQAKDHTLPIRRDIHRNYRLKDLDLL